MKPKYQKDIKSSTVLVAHWWSIYRNPFKPHFQICSTTTTATTGYPLQRRRSHQHHSLHTAVWWTPNTRNRALWRLSASHDHWPQKPDGWLHAAWKRLMWGKLQRNENMVKKQSQLYKFVSLKRSLNPSSKFLKLHSLIGAQTHRKSHLIFEADGVGSTQPTWGSITSVGTRHTAVWSEWCSLPTWLWRRLRPLRSVSRSYEKLSSCDYNNL